MGLGEFWIGADRKTELLRRLLHLLLLPKPSAQIVVSLGVSHMGGDGSSESLFGACQVARIPQPNPVVVLALRSRQRLDHLQHILGLRILCGRQGRFAQVSKHRAQSVDRRNSIGFVLEGIFKGLARPWPVPEAHKGVSQVLLSLGEVRFRSDGLAKTPDGSVKLTLLKL